MKTRFFASVAVSLLLSVSWLSAEEIAGLPLHIEELGDGAIRVWLGDHASTTTVVAFATHKGIVVVDTFGVPKVDTELRKVIARELGRADFSYLINTHEHRDHTGGNSVYADCTIVGHELVTPGLAQISGQRNRLLEFYPRHIAEMESELEDLGDENPGTTALRENLIYNRLFFEALTANEQLVPPILTFRDHMELDLGDTTFELWYIGGMHTASDAAVFIPERELLLTGDTMADVWLTDRPGCLAAFMVRDGMPHDFPRWLANWDRVLAESDRIGTLMPAHWNGELSLAGAEARVEYIRTLWDGIHKASASGEDLGHVQETYRLDSRFPELVGSPGFSQTQHYASVTELWKEITGQASAARTLYTLIDGGADEGAIQEVLAEWNSDVHAYFFDEVEMNAYGYAFLRQRKVEEAVKMFRINVNLYPESWNAYDSLGEALLAAGKTSDAVTMYEKSIALNPENEHGKEVLEGIRSSASM